MIAVGALAAAQAGKNSTNVTATENVAHVFCSICSIVHQRFHRFVRSYENHCPRSVVTTLYPVGIQGDYVQLPYVVPRYVRQFACKRDANLSVAIRVCVEIGNNLLISSHLVYFFVSPSSPAHEDRTEFIQSSPENQTNRLP